MKTFRIQTQGDSHKHIRADQMVTLPSGHTQLVRHRNVLVGNVAPDQRVTVQQTIHEVVAVFGPGNLLVAEIEVDDWAEESQAGSQSKQPSALRSVDNVPKMWRDAKLDPPTDDTRVLAFDEDFGQHTGVFSGGRWRIWRHPGLPPGSPTELPFVTKWRELPEGP